MPDFTTILLQTPASGSGNPLLSFLPMILLIGIFYFMVFMPMQKQRRQQAQMLKNLENGHVVVTNGGIIGTIVAINPDDTLILRIKPDNLKLQVARSAVQGLFDGGKA